VCQTSDLTCQIDMWSWNWIIIDIQLIMFVDVLIALWSWNTADSCDSLEFSWETLILQVLIIIVQNIILSQAVSCHKFHNLISQHSVFMRRRQLSVVHYFCHIVKAHLLECDLMSQLWECIQNWNWSEQVLIQLWIIFSSYWMCVCTLCFSQTCSSFLSSSWMIVQSLRSAL